MSFALLTPDVSVTMHAYGEIASVVPLSLASDKGLRPGDVIQSINGHPLRDVIDFRFYTDDEHLDVVVQRQYETFSILFTQQSSNTLGIELKGTGLESIRECNNHCPFCFVTQLPPGMRASMNFKDDDYRYSFLWSHFVTLTNLDEADWLRIEQQHLSPLYVSVHSTDTAMRRKLLGNKFAEDPLAQIDRLAALDINVHTQLVTCPAINDGAHMEQSISDLMTRYPKVSTIAVVPVGLTKIRTERTMSRGMPLRKFQRDEAARLLDTVEQIQQQNMRRYGEPVLYACDEFYLVAERDVPPETDFYDDAQRENGVGGVRQLLDDWSMVRPQLPNRLSRNRHLTMVCGTLIAPVLEQVVADMNTIDNLRVDLRVVTNTLFGDEVTCSGLMVGKDVLASVEHGEIGDTIVLPRDMFDHTGLMTLDDISFDELQNRAGRPIATVKRFKEIREIVVA